MRQSQTAPPQEVTALDKPSAFLVGKCADPNSNLARRLSDWGAECHFAASYGEACSLLRQQTFDLILSEMQLADGSARRLVPLLEGSSASLYCSYPIEDSCLWIPVVDQGRECWGSAPMRPGEFGLLLRRTLANQRSGRSC